MLQKNLKNEFYKMYHLTAVKILRRCLTLLFGGDIISMPQFCYGKNNKGLKFMLRKFCVENYKGFEGRLEFDLSNIHDYRFHSEAVENGISKKSLVFGRNGSGKSNLGSAIMDLTRHLTDKLWNPDLGPFRNMNRLSKPALFSYTFQFGDDIIEYTYEKDSPIALKYEELKVNGARWLFCAYGLNSSSYEINIPGAETLDMTTYRGTMSLTKFIYSRDAYKTNGAFHKFMNFVDNMLSFRCLRSNEFQGFKTTPNFFADIIIEHGKEKSLKALENYLAENGLIYKLEIKQDQDRNHNEIFAKFGNQSIPLHKIWSTGTQALVLFFCWSLEFNNISFLFLDEFDAFYHYELSEKVLEIINQNLNFQSIVTTHNCSLMSNDLTRPDCCYIISNNQTIKNLTQCTTREIREAHNLENLYKNNAFAE